MQMAAACTQALLRACPFSSPFKCILFHSVLTLLKPDRMYDEHPHAVYHDLTLFKFSGTLRLAGSICLTLHLIGVPLKSPFRILDMGHFKTCSVKPSKVAFVGGLDIFWCYLLPTNASGLRGLWAILRWGGYYVTRWNHDGMANFSYNSVLTVLRARRTYSTSPSTFSFPPVHLVESQEMAKSAGVPKQEADAR